MENLQNGQAREGDRMDQQSVKNIGKNLEDKAKNIKKQSPMYGIPWKVERVFSSFEDADKKRNLILQNSPDTQVKVKREANEQFSVRIRKIKKITTTKKRGKKTSKKKS